MKKFIYFVMVVILFVVLVFIFFVGVEYMVIVDSVVNFLFKDLFGLFSEVLGMVFLDEVNVENFKFYVVVVVNLIKIGNGMCDKKVMIFEYFD